MPATKQPENKTSVKFQWAANLEVSKIPDQATVAPVKVTARTGDAIDHPYWGAIVHDLAGMVLGGPKIVLDYQHWVEIGYLDTFDISSGDLVCTGAIVPVANDPSSAVVQKMAGGVPYQASIEFDDDDRLLLEFVPEGFTATVNNRSVMGPVTIVRQWTLIAVAVCKLGQDDETSAELNFSKKPKKASEENGFFVRVTKIKDGNTFNKPAGDANLTNEKTAATAATDTKVDDKAKETPAPTAPPAAVETPAAAAQLSKAPAGDVREDFKRFVTEFGKEKAAEYFSEGLDYPSAVVKHLQFQKTEIEALRGKIASVDRGEVNPVKFSKGDSTAPKQGWGAVIKKQNS